MRQGLSARLSGRLRAAANSNRREVMKENVVILLQGDDESRRGFPVKVAPEHHMVKAILTRPSLASFWCQREIGEFALVLAEMETC